MQPPKYSLKAGKEEFITIVKDCNKTDLARWAIVCATRVLPLFQKDYPTDDRPQHALSVLQVWIETGKFSMSAIRSASLAAHAAARNAPPGSPARSAARACGQAVATAHVLTHAIGAAIYAQQAILSNTGSTALVQHEKEWQLRELYKICKIPERINGDLNPRNSIL